MSRAFATHALAALLGCGRRSKAPSAPAAPSNPAFVVKLAPDGTVVYSTLLSGTTPRGSGQDGASGAWGVAADAAGHAFVVGDTSELDFPTTDGAAIRSTAESSSGFVTELASDGSALVYSTLLGATERAGSRSSVAGSIPRADRAARRGPCRALPPIPRGTCT